MNVDGYSRCRMHNSTEKKKTTCLIGFLLPIPAVFVSRRRKLLLWEVILLSNFKNSTSLCQPVNVIKSHLCSSILLLSSFSPPDEWSFDDRPTAFVSEMSV